MSLRLNKLIVHRFLAIDHREMAFPDVMMIAGPNESGKSSLLDAIRFALLDGLPREIKLKKDARMAIYQDGEKGYVESAYVENGKAFAVHRQLPSAKRKGQSVAPASPFLAQLLGETPFAKLSDDERRSLLLELTGTQLTGDVLINELAALKIGDRKIEAVAAAFDGAGIGAARELARTSATEAKGAWRAMTHETWGASKGAAWAPEGCPWTDKGPTKRAELYRSAVDEFSYELGLAQQELGQANQLRRDMQRRWDALDLAKKRAAGLQEANDALTAARERVKESDAEITKLEAEQEELEATERHFDCAWCGEPLQFDGIRLVKYLADPGPNQLERSEYLTRRKELHNQLVAANQEKRRRENRVSDCLAEIARCNEAQKYLDSDPAGEGPRDITAANQKIEEAQQKVENFSKDLELARQDLMEAQRIERGFEARARALAEHLTVIEWLRIDEALAPSGIPAKLLKRALAEPNGYLLKTSQALAVPVIQIGEDMRITYGGRLYQLCSKSAQWVINAAIQHMIAGLSGVGVMLLDEMDVLHVQRRGRFLQWLYESRDTVQSVVAATLKNPPAWELDGLEVVWLGSN